MTIENFKDNKEALDCYDTILNTKKSLFLTGKAGSGKSTLLRVILEATSKKHIICAPTGIAARNVGGQTLHSTFRLPLGLIFSNYKEIRNIWYREEKLLLFKNLELLIIDEISMVPSYTLDCIDSLLRQVRGNSYPFGGVQVLYIGDPFQLAPIVKYSERDLLMSKYDGEFFFDSNVFKRQSLKMIELTKCYRQTDLKFMKLLDSIRDKSIKLSELKELNEETTTQHINEDDLRITLTPINEKADQINYMKLAELPSEEFTFSAEIVGKFDAKNCIADQFLRLKVGAHVMFIKNKPALNFVNGTMGIVHTLTKDLIKVMSDEDILVTLTPEIWEDIEYQVNLVTGENEKTVVGSLTQFPIKLAYSVSIHKSQGLTFKEIILDTAYGAFAAGQIYTALSRCVSIEGLYLVNKLLYREIIVNRRVVEFYKQLKLKQNVAIKEQ